MSATDGEPRAQDDELFDYPTFELCCLFDDPADPTEVTLFPARPYHDISTEWISVDAAHAVDLANVA